MVPDNDNSSKHQTPFTVSVDAKHGTTTGISAYDRAHTILTAIRDDYLPMIPAKHVFLQAQVSPGEPYPPPAERHSRVVWGSHANMAKGCPGRGQ